MLIDNLLNQIEDKEQEIELLKARIRQLELQRDYVVRKLLRLEQIINNKRRL